jgi:hypothetical protein
VASSASQPPGRSSREALASPMAGSIQWKAVADTIRSKDPLPVKSAKEPQ